MGDNNNGQTANSNYGEWDDDGFEDYQPTTVKPENNERIFLVSTLVYVLIVVGLLWPMIWLRRLRKRQRRERQGRLDDKSTIKQVIWLKRVQRSVVQGQQQQQKREQQQQDQEQKQQQQDEDPKNYDDYDWKELPPQAKNAAAVLGYSRKIWDNDGDTSLSKKWWDDLTQNQQQAAKVLGYTKRKWDNYSDDGNDDDDNEEGNSDDNSRYVLMKDGRGNNSNNRSRSSSGSGTGGSGLIGLVRSVSNNMRRFSSSSRSSSGNNNPRNNNRTGGDGPPLDRFFLCGGCRPLLGGSGDDEDDLFFNDLDLYDYYDDMVVQECLDQQESLDAIHTDYIQVQFPRTTLWGYNVLQQNRTCIRRQYQLSTLTQSIFGSSSSWWLFYPELQQQKQQQVLPSTPTPSHNTTASSTSSFAPGTKALDSQDDVIKEEEDYDDYDWDELPSNVKDAATVLGYTARIWDTDGDTALSDMWWDDLKPKQQDAAKILGYTKDKWNNGEGEEDDDSDDDDSETARNRILQSEMTRGWETWRRVLSWNDETRDLLKMAIPATFDASSEPVMDAIETAVIAMYLGPNAYVASAMVSVFLDLTDAFICGVEEAEEILAAQAIGMRNYFNAGQLVQLTTVLYAMLAIPVYTLWVFTADKIVLAFGIDEGIAEIVRAYIPLGVISHFTENSAEGLSRLMWCAGNGGAMAIFDLCFDAIYVVVLVVSIHTFGVRSLVTVGWINVIISLAYATLLFAFLCWKGWLGPYTKGLFRNFALRNRNLVRGVIKMALPLSVGTFLSQGEWEILTFFAASMGPAEVAAWSIAGAIWEVFECVPSGIQTACEIRLGYHLGRGDPSEAKISAYKSLFYSVILSSALTIVFVCFRSQIIGLFTDDATLITMINSLVVMLSIGCVVMNIGTDAYTIICAQLRTKVATSVYFFSMVCVTMPLAAYFVLYHNFGLESLLFSTVAGYTTLSLCLLVFTFTSKWPMISEKIIEKADKLSSTSKKLKAKGYKSPAEMEMMNLGLPPVA